MHSHTYSGNPLGCSAALGVLDVLENERIIEKNHEKAKWLHRRLVEEFSHHKNVGEIRHIGLINAVELVVDKETKEGFDSTIRMGYQIYKEALKEGLLLRPLGNVLYFNPPLTITQEELEEAIAKMKSSLSNKLSF